MIRVSVLGTLLLLAPLSLLGQSVELSIRLPPGGGSDPVFGEIESRVMDRFFDAGLVLTTGEEAEELDIVGLCARSSEAYMDWTLVLDMRGAAAPAGADAKVATALREGKPEFVMWSLYRSKDGAPAGSASVSLPDSALGLADRGKRLEALGDAVAASVLPVLRSGAGSLESTSPQFGGQG